MKENLNFTDISITAFMDFETFVKETGIELYCGEVISNLQDLHIDISKDENGYIAKVISDKYGASTVIMESDLNGHSEHALFHICLSNFLPMTFENFILATAYYIENEEEDIEEFLIGASRVYNDLEDEFEDEFEDE